MFIDNFIKIFDILNSQEKKQFIFLFVLILFSTLIDMLGFASVLPFVMALSKPELIESNLVLSYLYKTLNNLGYSGKNNFFFFLGILVFFLIVTSIILRALVTYSHVRFTLMREHSLSELLMKKYLYQPYAWFLSKNSSALGKNILSEVNQVISGIIIPIINVIVQGIMIIGLVVVLALIDPVLILIVSSVLIFSYFIIFFLIKNVLVRLGISRFNSNEKRFTIIKEAFEGIKELKATGLEDFYLKIFSKNSKIYALNQSLSSVIIHSPRYFIEAVAFGGMILLLLVLIKQDKDFLTIIPMVTLYALAGYRLLPALQLIYNSLTQLKYFRKSLDSFYRDLKDLKTLSHLRPKKNLTLKFNKAIRLNNVSFSYPGAKKETLQKINITIPALTNVAITGRSGSGKTTLIDIILGLLTPNKGNLIVDNNSILPNNKNSWQKNIGYVPQKIYLSDASIAENIAFGSKNKEINQKLLVNAAKIANLHDFIVTELDDGYDTFIGENGIKISGGQRQRIGIARAFYNQPRVIILDEATSALDRITENNIIKNIINLKNKMTVILVSHQLEVLKNFDTIFYLKNGKIDIKGNYNFLLNKSESFRSFAKKE
jgi:ABC-type bacteriocin/lantibiotic exporter with double-glycine peptidase domain